MSLYPSLEDMKVDQMMKAQCKDNDYNGPPNGQPPAYPSLTPSAPVYPEPNHTGPPRGPPICGVPVYPALADYMGLDISPKTMTMSVPDYSMALAVQPTPEPSNQVATANNMVAPITGQSMGLQRAHVTNGIRELILCKDKDGRVGIRVASVNSGVFVCLVTKESPAALGGLRFGDQILQINGNTVAGCTMDQVHKMFKKADVNNISVVIRDRPFERTVVLHKDSAGHVGFHFKKGEIVSLVKDSSATRNGLLTGHHLLEVEGVNVVGLKDKEISAIMDKCPSPLTVTIIPTYIYEHIVRKMSNNLIKNLMTHNVPDL